MEIELNLQIKKGFGRYLDKRWLKSVVQEAVNALAFVSPVELSLVITDAVKTRRLNREYRGKNKPTDVLAFSMMDGKDEEKSFVNPPDGVLHLGEVVISYPQAAQQAAELGHSTEEEVALLIIHGVLHLVGYDHEQANEEEKMRAKEKEIMARIRFSGDK